MNERIKELWTQAEQRQVDDNGGVWVKTIFETRDKFAELIVKECADIALREEHDPYECIKKHFGVK